MTATHDFDRRIGDWLEEGAQTVPEWLVEQALDQAHATPQMRPGMRLPWETRPVGGLRRAVVVIALVLATLLAIVVGVGSNRAPDGPSRLLLTRVGGCFLGATLSDIDIQDPMTIPDSDVLVRLPDFRQMASGAQAAPGVFGLGDGVRGLSYGYESHGDAVYVSSAARGVVVAEVTMARSHGSLTGARLGETPEGFVAGLRDVAGFTVVDPEPVRFAELRAFAAHVSTDSTTGWKHIDRHSRIGTPGCVVDFALPSRVTVVDVDGTLVLVQVWAASEEGLRTWLPGADAILESMRISRI
jgi:hypothetical protein